MCKWPRSYHIQAIFREFCFSENTKFTPPELDLIFLVVGSCQLAISMADGYGQGLFRLWGKTKLRISAKYCHVCWDSVARPGQSWKNWRLVRSPSCPEFKTVKLENFDLTTNNFILCIDFWKSIRGDFIIVIVVVKCSFAPL